MTAPPCKLAPRTHGSSTNHFIRAWTRTKLKKFTPIKYTPVFPSVDLRTGQTGNLSGSACGLWPLGSPDIKNCFHTKKKRDWWCDNQCSEPGWCPFFQSCELQPEKNVGSIRESQYYICLHLSFTKLITSTCSKYTSPRNTNCRSNPTSHPVPEHFPSSALAKPSGLIDGRTDISVAGGHRQIRST